MMISLFSIVLSQNLFAKSGVIPAGNTIWECVTANKYFRITTSQDIETRNFGTLIFDENQEFQVQSLGENDRRSFSATLIFKK